MSAVAGFPTASHEITQAEIDTYADVTGDYNPLHVDPEVAAKSPFGSTIAHGPLVATPFFRAVVEWGGVGRLPDGTRLDITYVSPGRPGDLLSFVPIEFESGDDGWSVSGEVRAADDRVTCLVRANGPKNIG